MIRILLRATLCPPGGCHGRRLCRWSFSGRQRPAPGYDNVNMGSSQPGQQHRYDEPPPASQRDPYSRSEPGYY